MIDEKMLEQINEPQDTMGEYEKKVALAKKMLREGKGVTEIRGATDLPRSSIYKLRRAILKEKATEGATKRTVIENVEVTSPKIEDITTETPAETTRETAVESTVEKFVSGEHLDDAELQIIFEQVNHFLEQEDQLPDKPTKLLARLWKGPINRYLDKLGDENADVKIALAVTALVLGPRGIHTIKSKLNKRSQK